MAMRKRDQKIPIKRKIVDTGTGEMTDVDDYLNVSEFDLGLWFKLMKVEDEVSMIPLDCLGVPFMVFYVLLKRVIWIDCTVAIDPACRGAIFHYVGIKDGMIAKYIGQFCKSQLLKQIKGNSYMINPRYFYIGDKEHQIKLLKIFSSHGQKF